MLLTMMTISMTTLLIRLFRARVLRDTVSNRIPTELNPFDDLTVTIKVVNKYEILLFFKYIYVYT